VKKEIALNVEKKSILQEQVNIVVVVLTQGFACVGFKNQGQGVQADM